VPCSFGLHHLCRRIKKNLYEFFSRKRGRGKLVEPVKPDEQSEDEQDEDGAVTASQRKRFRLLRKSVENEAKPSTKSVPAAEASSSSGRSRRDTKAPAVEAPPSSEPSADPPAEHGGRRRQRGSSVKEEAKVEMKELPKVGRKGRTSAVAKEQASESGSKSEADLAAAESIVAPASCVQSAKLGGRSRQRGSPIKEGTNIEAKELPDVGRKGRTSAAESKAAPATIDPSAELNSKRQKRGSSVKEEIKVETKELPKAGRKGRTSAAESKAAPATSDPSAELSSKRQQRGSSVKEEINIEAKELPKVGRKGRTSAAESMSAPATSEPSAELNSKRQQRGSPIKEEIKFETKEVPKVGRKGRTSAVAKEQASESDSKREGDLAVAAAAEIMAAPAGRRGRASSKKELVPVIDDEKTSPGISILKHFFVTDVPLK
jgi:hypothetical protein